MRIGMLRACLTLLAIAPAATPAETITVDAVRVQVLSPTLVRLEERGPNGFEDRTTFHVVSRESRRDAGVTTRETADATIISAERWRLRLRRPVTSVVGLEFRGPDGEVLYRCGGNETNSVWLPSPGEMPPAWAFADKPRIVPPARGALPPPADRDILHASTSGWDLSNDALDVYVFLPDGDYRQLRSDFLNLTGPTPMPPLYAFGAWDSRYHPYTEETALAQIDGYRDHHIPLDVLVIDTDWRIGASHGYGVNAELFPDMPRFIRAAKQKNVRLMYNDHPEPVAGSALAPEELQYRYDGLASLLKMGIDVWWYDRNWDTHLHEPAPGIRKEVWGMRLYRDITRSERPNLRPMIMANVDGIDNGHRNRPPNVAAHRFPIQWTGDTQCSLRFLGMGIENAVHSGVHAVSPYVSEDLTGHVGRPAVEDYVRWVQFGALSPVFRLHCTRGDVRVPWEYGDVAESITRDYLQMRYRLLPVFYAAARNNYETGEPLLRRLDLEWPKYAEARRDDQYMLGDSILVAPICRDELRDLPAGWLSTAQGKPGLHAEYFNNRDLEGAPAVERVDSAIDFEWTGRAPAAGLGTDDFSVRWTGKLGPIPGDAPIGLRVAVDDGARVYLDGELVIDEWRPQPERVFPASRALQPGHTYDLRVEYQQYGYDAACRLKYEPVADTPRSKRTVWFPPGEWIDVWSGKRVHGPRESVARVALRQTPMFVRSGSIIPLAPNMQFTHEKPWSPITLDVYPSPEEAARATLYEDDGIGDGYLTGDYRKTALRAEFGADKVEVLIEPARGRYAGENMKRAWRVRMHAPAGLRERAIKTVTIDGRPTDDWKRLPTASGAMPFADSTGAPDGPVVEVSVPEQPTTNQIAVAVVFKERV